MHAVQPSDADSGSRIRFACGLLDGARIELFANGGLASVARYTIPLKNNIYIKYRVAGVDRTLRDYLSCLNGRFFHPFQNNEDVGSDANPHHCTRVR